MVYEGESQTHFLGWQQNTSRVQNKKPNSNMRTTTDMSHLLRVLIFEGELAASAKQNWPVVSTSYKNNYSFSKVTKKLSYSLIRTKRGKKLQKRWLLSYRLGELRLLTCQIRIKMLLMLYRAGDAEAVSKAIWNASPYQPDGIVDGKSLLELVTNPSPPCDFEYPFAGLQR